MNEKRNALMFRWSVISAAIIGLFWLVWYFIAGQVPAVSEIQMTPKLTILLPFDLSRWLDILIGPIWSILLVRLFTDEKLKNPDVIPGLILGLTVGLFLGLAPGLGFGLVFGLAVGLAFGLVAGLSFGLAVGLAFGLGYGLTLGLIAGLVAGLSFGLAVGLIFWRLKKE